MKVKSIVVFFLAVLGISFAAFTTWAIEENLSKSQKEKSRYFGLFSLLNDWMYINNHGASISDYLTKKGYKRVAIYGMSHIGHRLKEELEKKGLTVCYGVDRDGSIVIDGFKIYSPQDILPKADAIIIATYQNYEDLRELLQNKTEADVLFVKDILSDLMHMIWEENIC